MNVSYNVKEELCIEHTPGAGAIVIFGASGDLTKRKLLPSYLFLVSTWFTFTEGSRSGRSTDSHEPRRVS